MGFNSAFKVLNIQGLRIFGTEQSCWLFLFEKCLLRILVTKSTTAVDYFVVFISFNIQMTEELLKLVKCCFVFDSYAGFYLFIF